MGIFGVIQMGQKSETMGNIMKKHKMKDKQHFSNFGIR